MKKPAIIAGLFVIGMLLWWQRAKVKGFVMQASEQALSLIRGLETLKLTAYRDAGGWSIGYGHYMGPNPTIQQIDEGAAESLLSQDVAKADAIIARYVKVPLTQNQHDAIVSATFNLGTALFWNSKTGSYTHFLQKLNAGDYEGAASELKGFVYSQGQILPALVARREAEKQLFLS